MTFTEAAAHILRLVGKPLHYKEITDVAIERSLLSHVGKSPEVTMGARLAAQVKKAAKDNPLVRVKPGVFALGAWDEKTVKDGLADRTSAIERMKQGEEALAQEQGADVDTSASEGSSEDVVELASEEKQEKVPAEEASSTSASDEAQPTPAAAAAPAAAPTPAAAHREIAEVDDCPPDADEQHRAELSASATKLFEDEDDDDQPIFGAPDKPPSRPRASDDEEERPDDKRRRRRRRGRSRRDEGNSSDGGDDLPTYTVSDADPENLPQREESSEAPAQELPHSSELEENDNEPAASLSDALETALSKYDRGRGPVAAQNIADTLRRRLKTDLPLNAAAVIAVAHADNLACERSFRPPRFRVSANKLALTSWSMDRRAQDRHRALGRAAEQVTDSTLRGLSDELKRLSQRAMGELVAVLLDRMGVRDLVSVRRPGAHGSELHLSGVVRSGGLDLRRGGALSVRTAIMIRRDGKDIGRERVTELRGALHHYGSANQGWLITCGQVLSGAREESQSPGGSPVSLTGRHELAELCVAYGVGVRTHRIEVPVVDIELFENLQGR